MTMSVASAANAAYLPTPLDPEVEWLNLKGQEEMQGFHFPEAVKRFQRAVELDSSRPGLW
jgi:hypothetical protein